MKIFNKQAGIKLAAVSLCTVFLLGGCSNSDYDDPPNLAPEVSSISDQTISANIASDAISIRFYDDYTTLDQLQVTVVSSNQAIIADDGLSLTGVSNGFAQLVITPIVGLTGASDITVNATDEDGLSTMQTFAVTVVNQQIVASSLVRSTFAVDKNAAPVSFDAVDVVQDVEDENAFDDLINN